ncbi:MAG: gamma carbonic anhydrase family protein [Candidatus Saliniplasma sp.]
MSPTIPESCFIAKSCKIIGDVVLGEGCSIWPNAVLRGDQNHIKIEEGTNIQDCAVVHVDEGHHTIIGKNVTVGHGSVVHGCEVDDETIVGMNSTVLSGAKIGKGCIIGANALVREDMTIPDFSIAVGIPAKIIKEGDEEIIEKTRTNAVHYHQLRDEHKKGIYEYYRE